MAQAGYTPIQLYYSTTASAQPSAGNLANGELAINIADKKLYAKDSTGSVFLLASESGTTGTVSSVAMSVPAFLSVSGSPITSSGTLAVTYSGTALPTANGGTGSTSTTYCSLTTNVTGTLPVANGGTGLTSGTSGGILAFTAAGTLASSAALAANALVIGGGAGVAPSTTTTGTGVLTALGTNVGSAGAFTTNNAANTFTALQTFSGSSSVLASVLANAAETTTVSATAATGTINFDVTTQSVLYYTTNASGNFTVNFRASSGTSLNTALATNQTVTVAFLVTNGGTAYYNSAVTVDGVSVTPKWQGGTAPSAGNASSIDVYTYTIIKTASATFTVLASQTKFA